ncbi:hypothetical protein, partial [Phormidium sp. CCY1219]|uniref:hypothetical protein n=1 Tax=Phormidium sp. CCY1219 TaxID=2886104 RepID=UPI002D1EAA3B
LGSLVVYIIMGIVTIFAKPLASHYDYNVTRNCPLRTKKIIFLTGSAIAPQKRAREGETRREEGAKDG